MNKRNRERIKTDIIIYFAESGYSRIPWDYAEKWFIEHFKRPYNRMVIKLKPIYLL